MTDSEINVEKKSKGQPKIKKDSHMNLIERFDQNKLNHIVQNEAIYKNKMRAKCFDDKYNPFAIASKYLAKSKDGVVDVKYKQNASVGRFHAIGGLSLQSLTREIRHTIAAEFYNDIDIKNAHPVILAHICKERDITCKYLNRYNMKRDEFLAEISDDKETAKVVILSMINGGSKAKDALNQQPKWLDAFAVEINKIHNNFSKDKAFKAHMVKREALGIDYNHKASYMNILLCDFENKILQTIYKALDSPKDAVLCFDGLMLRKGVEFDLEAIEATVESELDIDIKLAVKPMTEGWEIDDDVEPYISVLTNCFDFSDPYDWGKFHKEFNGKNHDEEINSVMEKYPRVIAHILDGEGSYIKKMENGQVSVVKGLKSSDVKFRSEDGPISMTHIISFLPNSFSKISCKLTDCPENEFNLWSGFQAVRVVEQKSEGLDLMKSFIFEVWASSNQIHYDYIISWLAGTVTNLTGINRVALLMVSDQGTGKNTLADFMKLILRPCNVASVEGIEGVVGRFNTQVQNKRLIVMNELCSTREEFRNNFDKIKPIISDATITIEPKGVNKYELDNIANLIAFTNHEDAVSLEELDRRWAAFKMSNIYRNNSEYFDRIRDICFTQDVANQFYTYLLNFPAVNLSKIPMTDLKKSMINISKPSPLKFLDAINEDADLKEAILDGETRVKATLLYSKYREWCVENGERNIVSSTKFGTVVGEKLRKVHTRNGNTYEIL